MERKGRKRDELFLRIPLSLVERVAPLGPDATLLFAILYSVHVMQPKAGYFLLQAEFEAALGRGYRWWHRHTQEARGRRVHRGQTCRRCEAPISNARQSGMSMAKRMLLEEWERSVEPTREEEFDQRSYSR